ncbi:MAG: putative glycine dehydrogenase (decarboxylating) subunit 1 [Lentisphaerae bacterium ADurb.Bin242]|nr:MAG: putative glycine dehydrogenase (decarboxylating) subunit 1 [Lentisphaerae bacterium ADurb.Bin242]
MPYIANTDSDRAEMLRAAGFSGIGEMWEKAGVKFPYPALGEIPEGRSEYEVLKHLEHLASRNATRLVNFVGGGYYDHIIPSAVDSIISRGEFYTAYTPYQPEASQGTLQAIYEYQTAICRLTGMEVSNASLYDGGTALFEAMMMSVKSTGRRQVVISGAVSPIFRRMIDCYCINLDVERIEVPAGTGTDSNLENLGKALSGKTACVIVQYPNFFGGIEDYSGIAAAAHANGALAVCSAYPVALSVLKTPGEMDFDIVTGEGQSLGIPLSFGGPYLGFMAVKSKHMRKMPGRIVGRTVDLDGREGFVLTIQTREQHIRREHATSNICSNESLCALSALVYLTVVGKQGFVNLGDLCMSKAVFARNELLKIKGIEPVGNGAFFNEFVIKVPCDAAELVGKLIDKGFAAGFPLGRYYSDRRDQLLIAVTEKRSREDIKALANAMEALL